MRLLISTGEVSGDLQGSFLVKALLDESKRRDVQLEIVALGGPLMEAAGAELISNTASIGAIGFWEVLPYLIPTLRSQAIADALTYQHWGSVWGFAGKFFSKSIIRRIEKKRRSIGNYCSWRTINGSCRG